MSIFFKKIGDVSYTELTSLNNVIKNLNQYCGYEFKFTPTLPGNYCTVEISTYPVSKELSGKVSYDPTYLFNYSNDDTAYIPIEKIAGEYNFTIETIFNSFFNRYGRYIIEFNEYTDGDVLYRGSVMYFEVKSLINEVTFPFPGEGYEFDTDSGWSVSTNKSFVNLNYGSGNRCLYATSDSTLEIGDLVEINGVNIVSENEVIFNADDPNISIQKNNYGIVVGVFDESYVTDLYGDIVLNPLYIIGFEGQYIVPDFSFASEFIYFNNTTKTLTSNSSDLYVAKWDENTLVLLIENPISSLSSNINLSGSRGSLIKKGATQWEEFLIGDSPNLVLTQKDVYDFEWKYVSALRDLFSNNSTAIIQIGKGVKLGGVYDSLGTLSVYVEENDTTDFSIDGSTGELAVEAPAESYIKQYRRVEGLLGAKSSNIVATSTPTSGSLSENNKIYSMGENTSTSWMLYRYTNTLDYLGLHKITPEASPEITSVMSLGEINTTDSYSFCPLANDAGLLILADNTSLKLYVKLVERGAVNGTIILEEDYADIVTDCTLIHNIQSHIIDNTTYISFQYVKNNGVTVTTGLLSFTVYNLDWDDLTGAVITKYFIIKDNIVIASEPYWITFTISSTKSERDVVYALNYSNGGATEIQTIITANLRADGKFVEVGEEVDISNKISNFSSDFKIINLKSNLFVISYVDTNNLILVDTIVMYNSLEGLFTVNTSSISSSPVLEEFDSSDLLNLNLYKMMRVNDNQFILFYQAPLTSGTCLRCALGCILNNDSIFWIELSEAVAVWSSGNTLKSIDSAFTYPINTTGRIVVSYILNNTGTTANTLYNYTFDYMKYVNNPLFGITEEEIVCTPGSNEGLVGIGGLITVASASLVPGAVYYCDDLGNLTLTPTSLIVGTAYNTNQLFFSPSFIR